MVTKRIIPCLDIKDGKVVKGINFKGIKEVGDAVDMGMRYSADGADELVFLDITATLDGRKTFARLVEQIALHINIPFTVGGGISSLDDASRLLDAGADKVSVNSSAIARPGLIDEIAGKYGSQFVVLAIDARCSGPKAIDGDPECDGVWTCTTHGGTRPSDKELFSWASEGRDRGAGEILFTSMNHDGTKKGYACKAYRKLNSILNIPVIASGGAGCAQHIVDVLCDGCADAALAASIFHYNEIAIPDLKKTLSQSGIPVRL